MSEPNRQYHQALSANRKLLEENARLKADVERLRKAGDAMEIALQADFNGCPYEPLIIMKAIRRWRTAKDGKPSV